VRPAGSIAAQVFEDSLAALERERPAPATRRVPFDYLPPEAPPAPLPGVGATGAGPLLDALRDQRFGRRSSVELIAAALAAVKEHEPLRAMVALDPEGAIEQAERADAARRAGRWLGPLHGVPMTVKDVIDVAGLPTRAGSDAYYEMPTVDAVAVARLRDAGAIVIGKASTHEFALGVTTPQSRNPHDHSRIPGGSSGGSAITVSCGMGLASLGTDTRASIRCPAALSGVVGLKPTYGRVPTTGVVALSWTMDHVAPMASTVADVALVMDVLNGGPPDLVATGPRPALRVGVPAAAFDGAEPGVAACVRAALDRLGHAGADVTDVARPHGGDLDVAGAAGLVVSRAEAAAAHRSLGLDRSRYWEEVADQLDLGELVLAVDYLDAQRRRAQLADELLAAFGDRDVLAMPTVPVVAPPVADFPRYLSVLARNAIPWSLVGFPAISVPCGRVGGLPVGIQFVARPHHDATVIAAGRTWEAALAS
jgi:aspartyl-tRNA(Asn)/glutamyl-tRNA(Gln) amidotransferase subunit A